MNHYCYQFIAIWLRMDKTELVEDDYVWLNLHRNSTCPHESQKFWQIQSTKSPKALINWRILMSNPNRIEHNQKNAYGLYFDHYIGWFGGCHRMKFRFCQKFWQLLVGHQRHGGQFIWFFSIWKYFRCHVTEIIAIFSSIWMNESVM